MKTTIRTKAGSERIDTEESLNKNGFVYKSLQAYFNEFINSPNNHEERDMYFGSFEEMYGGSYLNASGAVEMMEEALMEHIEEKKLTSVTTRIYYDLDFEGLIQA